MKYSSVFDILKIGVGPSSSHTLGPWRASQMMIDDFKQENEINIIDRVIVSLYGSLSLTGKGHASDIAVMLGLCGFKVDVFDTEQISFIIEDIKNKKALNLNGEHIINFDIDKDIQFKQTFLPFHSNGMSFTLILKNNKAFSKFYYSIGGGFVVENTNNLADTTTSNVPFTIYKGEHVLEFLKLHPNFKISDFALQNEISLGKNKEQIRNDLLKIWDVMQSSIFLGIKMEGVLPGGLNVQRRAKNILKTLLDFNFKTKESFFEFIKLQNYSFNEVCDFINLFAIAVNEINASLGRVVTAPTNGSAGVIPAVLSYYMCFVNKNANQDHIMRFLLTSSVIGGIFKSGATISAAYGGCQAEIGVSSSMAAAALTELCGGSVEQCLVAAEIAMEHHLGMTCDPIEGLVQVPCIERNAMGTIKAINASNLALKTNPLNVKVNLDEVVFAMFSTAQDMNMKYKETSQGGLAQISVNISEC